MKDTKMVSKPMLSVILPNYNDALYIGESLDAILSQSYRPIEIIVIDDGSTDNSLEVINEYVKRNSMVRLLRNEKNIGAVNTIIKGLEHAKGEYVYTASANDRVLPGFFEKLMAILIEYPAAGLSSSDISSYDGRQYKFWLSEKPRYFSPDALEVSISKWGAFGGGGGNSIVKKSALLEFVEAYLKLRWYADTFIYFLIAFKYGMCYIPESLVMFRYSSDGYSSKNIKKWGVNKEIFDTMLSIIESPYCSDVGRWIKKSGVWLNLEGDIRMLPVFLYDSRYRKYLSLKLIRRLLWFGGKNKLYGIYRTLPLSIRKKLRNLQNWYRRYRYARIQYQ
jgi:glycosyltransferase involved in cell wall biosynthesis